MLISQPELYNCTVKAGLEIMLRHLPQTPLLLQNTLLLDCETRVHAKVDEDSNSRDGNLPSVWRDLV